MTDQHLGAPAAPVPTPGFNPRVSLAATLQACGTTAVLLGSGISSAAGVLTGWHITLDLIARAAAAEGVPAETLGGDPERWWFDQGRGQARYDEVLAALATTDSDRRQILRGYFETDARTGLPLQPTRAHEGLARLARRGAVPVIITTNFDRLMERALEAEGVTPQVISDPAAVAGMTPLPHAAVTVLKLHGDAGGGHLLNAPEELDTYDPAWQDLLQRIFDEYGLLVIGWSAEYDVALRQAVSRGVGRRYAWYWASYGQQVAKEARRLIAGRRAHLLETTGADELVADLEQRVAGLDRVVARTRVNAKTTYRHPLHDRVSGWDGLPLVLARAAVQFGPCKDDEVSSLGPEFREHLVDALNHSDLTELLRALSTSREPVYSRWRHR